MKSEPSEDPLIHEIPVFLSKSLLGQLHVLQYPVRPHANSYDDENIEKVRVKPESKQIELELGLHTRAPTFDRSKGEQIALNVDGAFREKKDPAENYYSSDTMDKLVLTSSKAVSDVSRYAVGVMGEGGLHLTPISSVLSIRPSFSYLDMVDKRNKSDRKEHSDDSDSEDKMKKVTVRFERPETERSKALKEKSYGYLQKKNKEEPWIPVAYNRFGSEKSEYEAQYLYCSYQNESVDQFDLANTTYLNQLIPPNTEGDAISPAILASSLKEVPLQDRVETLIYNAKVVSFDELLEAIGGMEEEDSILRVVQQVAILVQGNWVVKSDFLFPKDSASESFVPNELLQKTRDLALYLFTKNICIDRNRVSDTLDVPPADLTDILKGISRRKGELWEFLLPQDTSFLKKYVDVAQRQQMIWQSRYEQLSHSFKNS